MPKHVREFYHYLICLITLIISICAFVGLANSIAQIAFPYPPYEISRLETLRSADNLAPGIKDEETLKQWVTEQQQLQIERDKAVRQNRTARELANNLALLIVALTLYIAHWRNIKKFDAQV